ncbi:hypothetical protein [Sporosarcina ureae]|uniref:hypothetical protein n=1 Tax=Sporosarcina ureae TaxID=1571 RepID=UPI0026EDEA58|nr:hypothetical protein [Sporosarcina ureae]
MIAVQILILLTIGYIAMTIDKKQKNFPLPVFLVAIGFGLSFIPYFDSINIFGGTMSIFLLLSLADAADSSADVLVSLGFAVVFLSLVVQSIGIYPLSKALDK